MEEKEELGEQQSGLFLHHLSIINLVESKELMVFRAPYYISRPRLKTKPNKSKIS